MRRLAPLLFLLVAACGAEPVTVGSKDAPESRLLARMFAILLEERGVPVVRRIPVGDTARTFAALRRGTIDLYPEYAGAGLSLMGLPSEADGDAAFAASQAGFDALGLAWLPRFGFEAAYVVTITAETAARRRLETMEDLVPAAGDMRLGVTTTFAQRTGDGLRPWLERYGLDFAEVRIVEGADRGPLYDALAKGRIDVMVGVSTDPDVEAMALATLVDRDAFFPTYPAAPLARADALSRAPAIAEAAEVLSGALDAETIRALNAAMAFEGLSAREAAESALNRLGLLERSPLPDIPPFNLALSPADRGAAAANQALRALRAALPGRRIATAFVADPVAAIGARDARLALAPAIAHFEIEDGRARLSSDIETVAVVGSAVLHALVTPEGPRALAEARRIGAGPTALPLARAMAAHAGGQVEIIPLSADDAGVAAAALETGATDAAIVIAGTGRADLIRALRSDRVALADAASWWRGAARLALPFLREARLPASAYGAAAANLPVLSMQLTLAGPAPAEGDPLGRSGPSVIAAGPEPLTRATARRLAAALGPQEAPSPHLRAARALAPEMPRARSEVGFSPDRGLLLVMILAFLAWVVRLALRPRGKSP